MKQKSKKMQKCLIYEVWINLRSVFSSLHFMKRFLPVTPDASDPGAAYDPPLPPEMRQISISAPNGISPIVEVFFIVPECVCI